MQVVGVLFGAWLCGGISLCLGIYILRRFLVHTERVEFLALAFVVGSACFSEVLFFLCAAGLARKGVFLGAGLLAPLLAAGPLRRVVKRARFAPLPRGWKWLFGVLFALFGAVYLVNAMAPEMSPDGAAYHLPVVARYLGAHAFTPIPENLYASFPQGVELLFLPALSLGGNSAAAMVHFLFLLDLAVLMACYGRRFGFALPALAAAFLVFASPVVGLDGTSAYNDVATATILFGLYYFLQTWDQEQARHLLVPIGILAGAAFGAKYTAVVAVPYALGFVAWKLRRAGRAFTAPVLTIAAVAALFVLPWMIKNAIYVGNPVAPFANSLFANPNVHISFEQQYRSNLRNYNLTSKLQAPWELTVKGEKLEGFFGPVFLLAPLSLLALRRLEGRRLLLAGVVFAIPWFFNIGARFLIPALPPLALALALALAQPAGLLPAVALVHACLSWFATPWTYFDPYAPRIASFPIAAALRLEPEDAYLARQSSGYLIDRLIERTVPPGEQVFSFDPVPEAWTTRPIRIGYYSAENEVLMDILKTAMVPGLRPGRVTDFCFPPSLLTGLRVVRKGSPDARMWHVSELRLFAANTPIGPEARWQFLADPNPWDARLAFDNNLVTRWQSWQSATPGMWLGVRFAEPKRIDRARVLTASNAPRVEMALQGMDAQGHWSDLPSRASEASEPVTDDLRAAAVRALWDRGIRYLLVSPGVLGANEFCENAAAWGIRQIGESDGTRLYCLKGGRSGPAPHAEPASAAIPRGTYDDTDSRIALHAPWVRDTQFSEAYQHTLTYTDIADASIAFTFTGSSVTYEYTRAYNRGIAEVWLDGRLKDRVDLYAPEIAWHSRSSYGGLEPGTHTVRIRVTGERSPRSSDCVVDLDAVIVE
jgi:hypothetical protein